MSRVSVFLILVFMLAGISHNIDDYPDDVPFVKTAHGQINEDGSVTILDVKIKRYDGAVEKWCREKEKAIEELISSYQEVEDVLLTIAPNSEKPGYYYASALITITGSVGDMFVEDVVDIIIEHIGNITADDISIKDHYSHSLHPKWE